MPTPNALCSCLADNPDYTDRPLNYAFNTIFYAFTTTIYSISNRNYIVDINQPTQTPIQSFPYYLPQYLAPQNPQSPSLSVNNSPFR